MLKRALSRFKKTGLPPGSLVHVGERRVDKVAIDIMNYSETDLEERTGATVEEVESFIAKQGVAWVNVSGLHDLDAIQKIGEAFGLHPLTMEDVVNTDHRAKLELYDNYLFMVFKAIRYAEGEKEIHSEHVGLVLNSGSVLVFRCTTCISPS